MTIHLIDPTSKDAQIYAEAADWLLRLRDTDFDPEEPYTNSTERQKCFFAWATQSPAHVRAYMEIAQTYYKLGPSEEVSAVPTVAQISAVPSPSRILPFIAPRTAPRCLPRPWPPVASRRVALGLLLIFGLLIPVPLANMLLHSGKPEPVYYTAQPGERKVIALNDGSLIYLNTAARILVMDSKSIRGVQLLSGEALFKIQHSATPFRVFVDDVVVEDRGTEFSVSRDHADIQVAVTEGSVQLHCGGRESALRAGQRADITRDRSAVRIARGAVTPEQARGMAAQRDGIFVFWKVPLADVVRQFNHYNRRQLVLADPQLESFDLGGTIPIHDIDALIAAMHYLFGVTVAPPAGPESDPNVIRLIRSE